MNEQDLVRSLGELPREIRPQNDPWTEISARIGGAPVEAGAPAGRRRWALQAVAASALLVVTAGLLLGPLSKDAPPGAVDAVPFNGPRLTAGSFGLRGTLVSSEAEYQAAFREYIPVGESKQALSLKTVEMIESDWAELTLTENFLVAALEENPGDRFLNDRMLELRARQLGFLKQLARLDKNSRRMTI
jgi:hypothetical protein